MKGQLRQTLVVVAVIATILVNGLANALPLNGLTTGEISDSFDVLFVPAGYVFSIWGLIYVGLIIYAIYQALPRNLENPRLDAIAIPFLVASAANIAWLFLWHYLVFSLTIVAMLTLLASLILIYRRLGSDTDTAAVDERWLVHLPFSVYLAWVSVATIANASNVLSYFGWRGFGLGEETWAVIMLIVGLALVAVMSRRQRDIAYGLVFVWAYVGIGVAQAQVSTLVSTIAYVGAGFAAGLALYAMQASRRERPRARPAP